MYAYMQITTLNETTLAKVANSIIFSSNFTNFLNYVYAEGI